MNIDVEYKENGTYSRFAKRVQGKKVAIMFDKNTKTFADELKKELPTVEFLDVFFDDSDYIPTMENCEYAKSIAKNCGYLLAIGSGSLNDTAKYVATGLNIESGVLPTAASMDGYVSSGAALMKGAVKVTEPVNTPTHVLIDTKVIASAPEDMTASGFGDIIGKFTCLTDWKLSNILNGEEINEEAYALMEKARTDCINLFDDLKKYEFNAIGKLTDALLTAGISMAICGNSRPASGSEHHFSHFLEMDFVRRGERVPLHGVKVAIGTLISIELYNYLKTSGVEIPKKERIYKIIDELPSLEYVKGMLEEMGCPTRFSKIGVRYETMEEMLYKAYTVRNRYTILTFYHDLGLTDKIKTYIMDKYY